MPFSNEEMRMYQRQLILEDIGITGQLKLKEAKIGVIGAGGLGCPLLLYLATTGVGKLVIFDFDVINESNLHRQILYTSEDIGKSKAETATLKLRKHNPYITLDYQNIRLDNTNSINLLKDYDLIIDGSDNFETRYAIGDACAQMCKPLVSGAIYKFEGQVAVFNYLNDISYRDLFPVPPANDDFNCEIAGVTPTICAVIAGLMANEVIKIILQKTNVLNGKVLQIDLLNMSFNTFNIPKV
jgi:adenylyltransferase/sulfurtransferase